MIQQWTTYTYMQIQTKNTTWMSASIIYLIEYSIYILYQQWRFVWIKYFFQSYNGKKYIKVLEKQSVKKNSACTLYTLLFSSACKTECKFFSIRVPYTLFCWVHLFIRNTARCTTLHILNKIQTFIDLSQLSYAPYHFEQYLLELLNNESILLVLGFEF